MKKQEILENVDKLFVMWKNGELGGETMPEDSNPHFEKSSIQNYLYFTLPMALNYQRNSYKLWESARKTFEDTKTRFVFNIDKVLNESVENVKVALTKYKVALQPNKQTEIWIALCKTIKKLFDGDIRKLFSFCNYDIMKITNYVQVEHKKEFPYLSGNKICNYWLYVLYQYTNIRYQNIECLTVAPDTHVIQASQKLGVITAEEQGRNDIQLIVSKRWKDLLSTTKYCPIDIHTPLWLWSRNGFRNIE